MKKEIPVDGEFRIDALAAKMPVEPRADFSRRVFEALAEEIAEERLAEMPALPSPDFASRVMAAIAAEEKAKNNTAAFPRAARFFRSARGFAVGAAAAAIAVGVGLFFLAEGIAQRTRRKRARRRSGTRAARRGGRRFYSRRAFRRIALADGARRELRGNRRTFCLL